MFDGYKPHREYSTPFKYGTSPEKAAVFSGDSSGGTVNDNSCCAVGVVLVMGVLDVAGDCGEVTVVVFH